MVRRMHFLSRRSGACPAPVLTLLLSLALAALAPAQTAPPVRTVAATNLARIRDEGLNRSKVMETIAHLTDVIGPRLTGSPQMKRANEWTRDQMVAWGLTNAALEPWGTFGRGWSLQSFSAQLTVPESMPLIAVPKAWSPSLDKPIEAEVVFLDAASDADLEKYKGRLKGAIVLMAQPRELKTRFEPAATRLTETNLLRLANAGEPGARNPLPYEIQGASPRSTPPATNATPAPARTTPTPAATPTAPPRTNSTPRSSRSGPLSRTAFVMEEGAALLVTPSYAGEGGAVFAESASVPSQVPNGFRPQTNWTANGNGNTNGRPPTNQLGRSPWSTNAPPFLPQIVLAAEHYNRLVRLARRGEKIRARVELQARYHDEDLQGYNTIAEIPGSDLKDELVMLGGHLDSWHTGTGATDNAAGVAVCMEAVRILRALNLQPRRTIRVALWSGEEQGLLGSVAYVRRHFGHVTNLTAAQVEAGRAQSPHGRDQAASQRRTGGDRPERRLVPGPAHDKLSAYYNLDNGAGRIRGIYLQGLEAARPLFRQWLAPFADLGADTITLSNTGGTDHLPFVGVGLPGFQFIQDSLDYWTLTHHSNMDVYDRIIPEDLKQASVIMAAVIYQTAMLDEKLPRKTN
jgi:hypothetical protein